MRGLWTTASLFLLKAGRLDAQAIAAGGHACTIWVCECLEPLGIRRTLLHRGFLHERVSSAQLACDKQVKQIESAGRLFSVKSQNSPIPCICRDVRRRATVGLRAGVESPAPAWARASPAGGRCCRGRGGDGANGLL
jgi:hypothetical protein